MNSDKTKPKQTQIITISVISIILSFCSVAFLIILHAYYYTGDTVSYRFILYVAFPFILFLLTVGTAIFNQYLTSGSTNIALAFSGSGNMLKYIYIALFASYFTLMRAPVAAAAPFIDWDGKIRGVEDVQKIEEAYPAIKGMGIAYYVFFGIILGVISSLGSSIIVSSTPSPP